MPQFGLVIIYALAFLLTLAAIRKSLMVTGWEWSNEAITSRRVTYVIFMAFFVSIIAAVRVGVTLGYPATGCLVAIAVAGTWLGAANYAYSFYYKTTSG
ncbi:MAG TPA: hypothetical protein VNU47_01225 [Candidatus Paceibacterota bacterium]|nr:hypothetical protein [Candidatus Paceibacterota bacterium]